MHGNHKSDDLLPFPLTLTIGEGGGGKHTHTKKLHLQVESLYRCWLVSFLLNREIRNCYLLLLNTFFLHMST